MPEDSQTSGVGGVLKTTAKVSTIATFLPTILLSLPQWASLTICIVIVTCAAITASAPPPSKSRLLIALYQIVRVIGLNVGAALPYVATHLVKTPVAAPVPNVGPGSVITIAKETIK